MFFIFGSMMILWIASILFPPLLLVSIPLTLMLISAGRKHAKASRDYQAALADQFYRDRREKVLRSFL